MSRNTSGIVGWNWSSGSSRSRAQQARPSVSRRLRPAMLALECRQLLSTFTVANDNASGSGSLAQAIADANGDNQANTITFSSFFNTPQTITLGGSALELSDTGGTQTITAPAAGVTLSGGGQSGVFQVDKGVQAKISGLSITGGKSAGDGGGLESEAEANVTLTDCTISGNSAAKSGGGVNNLGSVFLFDCTISGNTAGTEGGGLANGGGSSAAMGYCSVSGNSAGDSGGGVYNGTGTYLTLGDAIVAGNTNPVSAPPGASSDIAGPGTVFSSYSLFGPGVAAGITSGVNHDIVLSSLSSLGLAPLGSYGGPTQTMALLPGSAAIGAGSAPSGQETDQRGFPIDATARDLGAFQTQPGLVVNTTIDGASAPFGELSLRQAVNLANVPDAADPGASELITFDTTVFATMQTISLSQGQLELGNSDPDGAEIITGPAAGVTINGGGLSRVFQIDSGVITTLGFLTIADGKVGTSASGGGIDNQGTAYLNDCTISSNSAGNGGGIDNQGAGILTLDDCNISGNTAVDDGGGLETNGTTSLFECTLGSNTAGNNGGALDNLGTAALDVTACTISDNSAGDVGGGVNNLGTASLTNCTISGNSAKVLGGGLYNNGTAHLTECTISLNFSSQLGGGVANAGSATLVDTIVADNSKPSAASDIHSPGKLSGTNNLIGTGGSGSFTNGISGNIVLSSLSSLGLAAPGSNGGSTQTMALLPGSAAIGRGIAAPNVIIDQRGVGRGAVVDIGAFQASLVVESASQGVDTTISGMTLAGALSLANRFPGSAITFDSKVFATKATITLGATLELSNTALTTSITGTAAGMTISGGGASRDFLVDSGVTAALARLTITGGKTDDDGGGLEVEGTANVSLNSCTISGNTAGGSGGGLYSGGSSALMLINSTVSKNTAEDGGGIDNGGTADLTLTNCTISGNTAAGHGGGLDTGSNANLNLSDCTMSGNSAGKYGGGLNSYGEAKLFDCTISGNSAGALGGGLSNNGTATLINCTVSNNSSAQLGGGLANGGSATLFNTIVALNTKPSGASDIHSNSSLTGTHNLIGTGGSGTFSNGGVSNNIVLTSLSSLGLAAVGIVRRVDSDHGPSARQRGHRHGLLAGRIDRGPARQIVRLARS